MLTIQTVDDIKRGSRFTLFNGVYAIVFGVAYIAFFEFIIKMNLRKIDVIWQIFSKYNPDLSNMIIRFIILKGLFVIALGIALIYLSNYILRRKDKAAWAILFIVGLILWSTLLAMEVLDNNFYTIIFALIGWITFIIGMLIPIRYYMQRDYPEY